MTDNRFAVEHRPHESRYVLIDRGDDGSGDAVIGEEPYVDVVAGDQTERVLFHTGVSEAYSGKGLASVLVRGAVDHLTGDGLKIVPVCPYVVAWLPKHPEYSGQVVTPGPQHIRAISEQQRNS